MRLTLCILQDMRMNMRVNEDHGYKRLHDRESRDIRANQQHGLTCGRSSGPSLPESPMLGPEPQGVRRRPAPRPPAGRWRHRSVHMRRPRCASRLRIAANSWSLPRVQHWMPQDQPRAQWWLGGSKRSLEFPRCSNMWRQMQGPTLLSTGFRRHVDLVHAGSKERFRKDNSFSGC
jgi:hypothetical protein